MSPDPDGFSMTNCQEMSASENASVLNFRSPIGDFPVGQLEGIDISEQD